MKRNFLLCFLMASLCVPLFAINIEGNSGVTRERLFPLRIKNAAGQIIMVRMNGVTMRMKSYDSFRRIPLARGQNCISVAETGQIWKSEDSIQLYADIPPVPLKIIHTWDSGDNYVDLYVEDPTGEIAYWAHRETKIGGVMDIGYDSVGYGPQIFSLTDIYPGVYTIYVSYYGGSQSQLTEIQTTVVLYEGTEREERRVFTAVLTAPGDRIFVGKIELK